MTNDRLSLFGHVARLDPEVPANKALLLMVNSHEGRKPSTSWTRPPGRPRRTNLVQEDANAIPLSSLRRTEIFGVTGRRNGPSGLHEDDDEWLTTQVKMLRHDARLEERLSSRLSTTETTKVNQHGSNHNEQEKSRHRPKYADTSSTTHNMCVCSFRFWTRLIREWTGPVWDLFLDRRRSVHGFCIDSPKVR